MIDYDVGVDLLAKPGERVEKSGTLCRLHAADASSAKAALARLESAFEISSGRPASAPLIAELVSGQVSRQRRT